MSRTPPLALLSALALCAPAAALAGPASLRSLAAPPPNVNSFVLESPQGVRVFLDVVAVPEDLAAAVEDPKNLFLVTHKHGDHFAGRTAEQFKGKKRVADPGTLESGDVKVTVVPSSHLDNEVDGHTNTIVVVDLGGVRVAHFGDCGQDTLTPEQVRAIGRVDVMIGQLENAFAEADVINKKGFKILAQVAPVIFIPTHVASDAAVKLLSPGYPPARTEKGELLLTPALLGKGKRALFLGGNLPLATRAGVPVAPDL